MLPSIRSTISGIYFRLGDGKDGPGKRRHWLTFLETKKVQWERVFIVDSLTVKCVCNPFSAVDNNLNSLFIASEKKKLLSNFHSFSY